MRRGFDVVLLDVRMPDGSGLELLPEADAVDAARESPSGVVA